MAEILEDGIYFFGHDRHDFYLGVGESQTTLGTELRYMAKQLAFSPTMQQWRVTYLGSGYYSIQSVSNGGYLSVYNADEDEGAPICLEPTFSAYSCSWAIVEYSVGLYKVLSKCGWETDQCLTVGQALGADCSQSSYKPDKWSYQEWGVYKVRYQATINNYYDEGYLVKHGWSETQAQEKIASYSNYAVERYVREVGLLITVNVAQYYDSPLDQCKGTVTSDNVDGECLCGQQHSFSKVISTSFSNTYSGSSTITNIYWTGHKVFLREGGDVEGNTNRSFSSGTMITMVDPENLSGYDSNIRKVLVHELAHQYEVRDHYHELKDKDDPLSCYNKQNECSECGEVKRSPTCVMNSSSNISFCDNCLSDLKAHLQKHHVFNIS